MCWADENSEELLESNQRLLRNESPPILFELDDEASITNDEFCEKNPESVWSKSKIKFDCNVVNYLSNISNFFFTKTTAKPGSKIASIGR